MIFKGNEMTLSEVAELTGVKKGTLQYRHNTLGLRDDDLIKNDIRDKEIVEVDGKEYTLIELSEAYDIHSATVRNRYHKGLRGNDLVKKVNRKQSKSVVTYYIREEPYRMTTKEQRIKTKMTLSSIEIQNRLNIGLSMHEALKFSIKYVAKFGQMCYEIEGIDTFYYIPYDDVQTLSRNGIEMAQVSRNVATVEDISELLLEDTRVYEESMDNDSSLDNELLERRKQESIQKYKDEKHREQKPHLYNGTKQSHSFGEYAQYLADSYTFACSDVKEEM